MGKHVVATVVGVLAGLALLAWLPHLTSPAVTFLFSICVAISNAAAVVVGMVARRGRKSAG